MFIEYQRSASYLVVLVPTLEYSLLMSASIRSPVHTINRSALEVPSVGAVQDFASQRIVNAAGTLLVTKFENTDERLPLV